MSQSGRASQCRHRDLHLSPSHLRLFIWKSCIEWNCDSILVDCSITSSVCLSSGYENQVFSFSSVHTILLFSIITLKHGTTLLLLLLLLCEERKLCKWLLYNRKSQFTPFSSTHQLISRVFASESTWRCCKRNSKLEVRPTKSQAQVGV